MSIRLKRIEKWSNENQLMCKICVDEERLNERACRIKPPEKEREGESRTQEWRDLL